MEEITVTTHDTCEMLDITAQIEQTVKKTGVTTGICHAFVPHTTAGITINENADPSVIHDILKEMDKVIPQQDGYLHSEGNSAAHIKSSLFGSSVSAIVEGGSLALGTWQSVFFCEFDGPRARKLWIQVLSA